MMHRKKTSKFYVDYKDPGLLKYMLYGNISSARTTRLSRKMQRSVAKAIKIARYLSLLPYN